jgi:predicted Zn-ribbon and HTH transcriptional regulator
MEANIETNKIEVADIFNIYSDEFIKNNNLSVQQIKTIDAIKSCRSSELGYHKLVCNECGHEQISYNSCRNRHCPKCQMTKQIKWIDKLKAEVLPVRYFHIVFTLPKQLRVLAYINQKIVYSILFGAASQTLKQVALNPKFLGAEPAFLAVLHTWGQNLSYHPHLHMIVSAGGLDPDGLEWKHSSKKFFVPVKALSKVFRAKFIDMLEDEYNKNTLNIPDTQEEIDYHNFKKLKSLLYTKNWNVYAKKTFKGAGKVIEYLGRYTHKVAISNSRIISLENGKVKLKYKDYRDNNKWKIMELSALEFIRRFVQHILPNNFYKIRYFGLLANKNRKTKLNTCFNRLKEMISIPRFEGLVWHEIIEIVTGKDVFTCPVCKKGRLINPALLIQNTE